MMSALFLLEIYSLKSLDVFENFFKKNKSHTYSLSLKSFFLDIVQYRIGSEHCKILDLGAGNYSLFEDIPDLNAEVWALDFSHAAIINSPQSRIKYREGSVVDSSFFPVGEYDLIFDSHCLNCITDEVERDLAFKNIYQGLATGGIFASEMMTQSIGSNVSMPFKIIKTTLDLEQEILSHGFKILYFMISRDSAFINEIDGIEVKCDLLKVVATK